MATVEQLSAPFGNVMVAPRAGPGVCRTCFNLTDGYDRCYACAHGDDALDAVVPISYSVAGEQLHHVLASYKRDADPATTPFAVALAAVLWRFLAGHERCVAAATGVTRFPLVTTVPSGDPGRDRAVTHPLARIAGELVGPTRDRYVRLLRRTDAPAPRHRPTPDRFIATASRATIGDVGLAGRPVLLIDDTWTTGASAQSAALALRRGGASHVAAVVIGRHLNRGWHDNDHRLAALPAPYDWTRCVFCAGAFTEFGGRGMNRSRPIPRARERG